jgi:hypothetical protein
MVRSPPSAEIQTDGVDGPLTASECQNGVVEYHQNGSHPWTRLAPSGSISRSTFSSFTELTEPGRSFCAGACGGAR